MREAVLGDVAEILDVGLQSPVPLVLLQQRVLVEEAGTRLADERVRAAHWEWGLGAAYPE